MISTPEKNISILVTSRIEGNVNHRLKTLLDSLKVSTNHPENLEVLIKYDNDDYACQNEAREIVNAKYPFRILCEDGPRGRGYTDIHHGYNQLLKQVNPNTKVIGAMADDFTCNGGWDDAVMKAIEGAGDYFIVHQRPHPRRVWKEETGKATALEPWFEMDEDMFESENLHIIDEAPLWSPALLRACEFYAPPTSTTPSSFPVSFTDAWTICLEHVLWTDHGINITKFLPEIFINRFTSDVDQPGNSRWDTDRKLNFDYIKSSKFRSLVMAQAREIACQLQEQKSHV